MKNSELTLKDFQLDTISKKQQKTITGGDAPPTDPVDPGKVGGGGNT
ncbi:rSAM-modified peptide [Flavobacterium ustbae]|nr:rSAM-modified peptide [Flavobacterium ustbae]